MKTLHPTAIKNTAEYSRSTYFIQFPPDVTFDDVMRPGFWSNHTGTLKVNDRIEAIGEGFDVDLRVKEVSRGFVVMRALRVWTDEAVVTGNNADEATVPDGYVVDHTPRTRWRVRLKDGAVELGRDLSTKAAAIELALDHSRKALGIAA